VLSLNSGRSSSHLSGRKHSASIPYRSGRRCIVYTLNAKFEPLGITTGEVPSGPPPLGMIVSLVAVRVLTGREGYRRRASRVSTLFYFLPSHFVTYSP
jgi:hypothetical protein